MAVGVMTLQIDTLISKSGVLQPFAEFRALRQSEECWNRGRGRSGVLAAQPRLLQYE